MLCCIILIFSLLSLNNISINCERSLVQLHAFIRHGERTPTETYPNDPYLHYNWLEGWGALTKGPLLLHDNGVSAVVLVHRAEGLGADYEVQSGPKLPAHMLGVEIVLQLPKGKLEIYELGQKFRENYTNFIPKYYWPGDVNVTSSYSVRCRNSADLFCAGLYPPKDVQIWSQDLLWQPIPVTYIERAKDTIIVMRVPCPKYDRDFEQVRSSEKIINITEKNRELFEYLTKYTGSNISTIEDVELLYNTIEIEQLHNLTIPNWLNDTLLASMKELGAINLASYSETEYMKRMKGGMFLQTVFSLMDKALSDDVKSKKINLYFGHDLSLVHIMRALNLKDTFKPDFAAYLILELYSDQQVQIIYSNSAKGPIEVNQTENLAMLKERLEAVLPLNYDAECQLDNV